MRNRVLLVTLVLAFPVWAANPPCTPVKKRPALPCCRCPSDPAIPQLTEQIGHLQQSVPGLTAAVTSLATATHNVSQAILLLVARHAHEWKKTFNTWRKPEVTCKQPDQ